MRFYYENNMGDSGVFQAEDLVFAIYSAWNIEANLYLISSQEDVIKLDSSIYNEQIFAPHESNDYNTDLLYNWGLYMVDGGTYREIRDRETNEIREYKWSDVLQLI